MRSRFHFAWLAAALVACATGVGGADDVPLHDAAITDTSLSKDTGSSNDGSTVVDATQDSGAKDSNVTSTCTPYTGSLVTFDFTGEAGNQTSTVASAVATDVTATDMTRASALTPTTGVNSINSSNWTTSTSLDKTRYYTFSIMAKSGCTLDVASLSISTTASKTGPTLGAVATSDDNYASTKAITLGAVATPALAVSGATGALEIRVYGYAANSVSGTLRVDSTLTVTGSLQ